MGNRTDNRKASRRLRRRLERRKHYATLAIGPNRLVASPEAVGEAIARLPEDLNWSSVKEFIFPLFARRRPFPDGIPPPVRVVLPPGLSVGFGVDIGPAFLNITDRLLERWGIDRDALVERALGNTKRVAALLEPRDVKRVDLDGLPIAGLMARILPASALLLFPSELERLFGPKEQLFIAPIRDLLLSLPANVAPETAAWIRDAMAEEDPNALALEGVRLRGGRLTCEPLGGVFGYG